ncbi:MAG: hypothetical protein DRP42_03805 [Tenericutes bacterium]|nr:MAG: hypothetical protein DRP42_03805 [Mycoplasmatota bacterium]
MVTEISNSVTSYTDTADDSELVTDAPTNNGLPGNFTVFLEHLEMMFGVAGNSNYASRLYYSNVNEPEIFSAGEHIRVGEGDGHTITGLAVIANSLVIAKDDGNGNGSVYLLYMPTAFQADWSLIRLNTANGGQSARVMERFSNHIMYLNKHGVFDLNEYEVGQIRSDALSFKIEPDIYNIAEDYIKNAAAITWKNKVWLSVPYGASTENNKIFQYDFVRGRSSKQRQYAAWSKFSNMNISDFTIHDGELYGGSSLEDGFVYKLDTGFNDSGDAIDSYYKTMPITGKESHRNNTKVWRELLLLVECTGNWNMDLTYSNDFLLNAGVEYSINLNPAGPVWGTAVWGTSVWSAGTERKWVKIVFKNSVSTSIQLKFATNAVDEYFKVHEARIRYNLRAIR